MKLTDIIRAVQSDLPITMRHERWLMRHSEMKYSEEALEFAAQALRGDFTTRRRLLFRSSGIGTCRRRRVFSAIGVPETQVLDAKLSNIFHTGNYLHLKWQMAGLTEGWLKEAEVIIDNPAINFGGTMDGLLHDGSGFEFKSINSNGFKYIPKEMHIRQVHAYMYLRPEIERFSIVYENKDTGEWREYRVEKDPDILHSIGNEITVLNLALEHKELPEVLPDCQQKQGTQYRQCPFKDICLGMKKWPTLHTMSSS